MSPFDLSLSTFVAETEIGQSLEDLTEVPQLEFMPGNGMRNSERGMGKEGWRMADGGWRMADGGWRMADGGWQMADDR
jgi:hypothetical protein